MTVINVDRDLEGLTMTITCEFAADVDRVWQVWADPRQLERWWGPPTYPATVTEHELVPGGRVSYHMTGSEGDRHSGWWQTIAVEAPHRLEFEDGFASDDGQPSETMPVTRMAVTLEAVDEGTTHMTMVSTLPSTRAMEQLIEMGMEEGICAALGQIDALVGATMA